MKMLEEIIDFVEKLKTSEDIPTVEELIVLLNDISSINDEFKWAISHNKIEINSKNIIYNTDYNFVDFDDSILFEEIEKYIDLDKIKEIQTNKSNDAAVNIILETLDDTYITNIIESDNGVYYFKRKNLNKIKKDISWELSKFSTEQLHILEKMKPSEYVFLYINDKDGSENKLSTYTFKNIKDHIKEYIDEEIIPKMKNRDFDENDIVYYWGIMTNTKVQKIESLNYI